MNLRDDDDLDGEGDDDDGHHCLHSKKEVCGLANFPRTCRDQIFRVFILRPHFASHNRVESPRFAHQVGHASDLHDPRSPPTCQMTHVIFLNVLVQRTRYGY